MDFSTAAAAATAALTPPTPGDDSTVRAALAVALHPWRTIVVDDDRRSWDSYGNAVAVAANDLPVPRYPLNIEHIDTPATDTPVTRADAITLVTAVADELDRAADQPHHDTTRRWAWARAAALLRHAASELQ